MSTLLRRGTGAALFFICTLCWSNENTYVETPNLEGDSENKYQQEINIHRSEINHKKNKNHHELNDSNKRKKYTNFKETYVLGKHGKLEKTKN